MVRHSSRTTVYQLWRLSWSTCLFVSSSYFQQAIVCVGVDSAVLELSITQCCWLLELISPLCLCLAFRAADALITQQVVSCVLCTYWSFVTTLLFFSFVTVHNVYSFISSTGSSLSSGRVWLWFRNQSPASWFHVVSHICSQCLICHIHILLQGKLKHLLNIRKINVMSNPLLFILFQSVLHIWTLTKKWLPFKKKKPLNFLCYLF